MCVQFGRTKIVRPLIGVDMQPLIAVHVQPLLDERHCIYTLAAGIFTGNLQKTDKSRKTDF